MPNNLQAIRRKLGLSQEDVAELTGYPRPFISRLETSSTSVPRLVTLERLAHALGCSVVDLLPQRFKVRAVDSPPTTINRPARPSRR